MVFHFFFLFLFLNTLLLHIFHSCFVFLGITSLFYFPHLFFFMFCDLSFSFFVFVSLFKRWLSLHAFPIRSLLAHTPVTRIHTTNRPFCFCLFLEHTRHMRVPLDSGARVGGGRRPKYPWRVSLEEMRSASSSPSPFIRINESIHTQVSQRGHGGGGAYPGWPLPSGLGNLRRCDVVWFVVFFCLKFVQFL